ncbi:MAG: DNA recombination/repair protein RecA, partial [Desulfobulbaceae bacterium]|nr:DNA recombination/repair protein RecA [Desulfobulbaceae bacterium]
GIVKKSGAWFSYESEKLGQGREAVKTLLKSDPALYSKIYEQVRSQMNGLSLVGDGASASDEEF